MNNCSICCREAEHTVFFGYRCKRCSRASQPFYMLDINNCSWRCMVVRKMIGKGKGYKIDAHGKAWRTR